MARRRRTPQAELRGFAATLLLAALAYWMFTSGLYVTVISGVADWYAEQVMPRPGMPSEAPAPTRLGPSPY